MPHLTNQEYLNSQNIDEYFHHLADEIKNAGLGEHHILVVGGAAMALKFRGERSTVDIDICLREQNHLYDCCQKVARIYKLPEDWINADVMHSDSFSYGLFRDATLYKVYADILKIYIVSNMDLYCMKLVSFRPKDIQDMIILAEKMQEEGISRKQIEENFIRLYGDAFLMKNDDRKVRFIEMQFRQMT